MNVHVCNDGGGKWLLRGDIPPPTPAFAALSNILNLPWDTVGLAGRFYKAKQEFRWEGYWIDLWGSLPPPGFVMFWEKECLVKRSGLRITRPQLVGWNRVGIQDSRVIGSPPRHLVWWRVCLEQPSWWLCWEWWAALPWHWAAMFHPWWGVMVRAGRSPEMLASCFAQCHSKWWQEKKNTLMSDSKIIMRCNHIYCS